MPLSVGHRAIRPPSKEVQCQTRILITNLAKFGLRQPEELNIGSSSRSLHTLARVRKQASLSKQIASFQHIIRFFDPNTSRNEHVEAVGVVSASEDSLSSP